MLTLVWVGFAGHYLHFRLAGHTLTPVEPSEAMQTLGRGLVNAGFVFFSLASLACAQPDEANAPAQAQTATVSSAPTNEAEGLIKLDVMVFDKDGNGYFTCLAFDLFPPGMGSAEILDVWIELKG